MIRIAPPAFPAVLVVCTLGFAASAGAQDLALDPAASAALVTARSFDAAVPATPVAAAPQRPAALLPLYVSFAALQALDVHSTSGALARGGVEANPLMKALAGNNLGLFAVKAAGTAGAIYASEQLWKKNKLAAVALMVATNSAMAWVVQNNYRAAR